MSYLVHQRSKSPRNQEMQRMHVVMHSKPLTTKDLEQDPEPEVSALDEDGDECVAADQMKRLWTRHSVRVQ